MANQIFPLPVKCISKYVLASADMYYSEEGQRDIYVYDDPMQGLRIWGETTNVGAGTSIDLCQIFLEYALFCQTLQNPSNNPTRT